ncbi:Store-operated calcium entry-associated regulatory factor [Sorochytrium milnesiophthora]
MRSPSLIVLSALVAAVYGAWGSRNAADKVRLSDIRALTLHSGEYTTGRRSSPVPQTKCTGGDACHLYEPDVIQCTNAGSDGRDVQWKCEAEMEDYYRFGKVTVTCEGYDHRNDPFVLAGSCGVEYALHLTDKGARAQSRADRGAYDKYRRFNDASHNYRQRKQTKSRSTMASLSEQAEGTSWVMVFVVMFALWAVVQYFR